MYSHGPNCLPGPVSRTSAWWTKSLVADTPIRQDLVERIRREIAAGTYDSPERWEAALERFFRRLGEE